jgi:hypothetical protein
MSNSSSMLAISNKNNWSFPLPSTHNSISYFTDLLQLEVHPLTHATTSHLVTLFDINTKKPKDKSSSN